jgi:hypothetical protein
MEQSIFSIRSGWISYAPFHTYQLPRLVYVTEREVVGKSSRPGEGVNVVYGDNKRVTVPFVNKAGNVMFTRPLFRLQWPGELRLDDASHVGYGPDGLDPQHRKEPVPDEVPINILRHLEPVKHLCTGHSHTQRSLHTMVCGMGIQLPRELPTVVAYHLAVNREVYYPERDEHEVYRFNTEPGAPPPRGVRHPVAALPERRVDEVLNARFAVDASYMAALRYLKWVAEGHHRHPMFTDFDTSVRETLMELSHKAAELYFYMLSDCMYDLRAHYWARDGKFIWMRLALYLHYVGRTGGGLYARLAGIDPPSGIRADVVEKDMKDVLDRVVEWQDTLGEEARRMSHVDYDGAFGGGASVGDVIDR